MNKYEVRYYNKKSKTYSHINIFADNINDAIKTFNMNTHLKLLSIKCEEK